MKRKMCMAAMIDLALLSALCPALQAQGTSRSVWQGVYTVDQSNRGRAQFNSHCASCHGALLAGDDAAPALAGRRFLFNWDGQPAADLADRIQTTMPQDNPGTLSRSVVVDITAYIFSVNLFPAGPGELPGDAQALREIHIDAENPDKK